MLLRRIFLAALVIGSMVSITTTTEAASTGLVCDTKYYCFQVAGYHKTGNTYNIYNRQWQGGRGCIGPNNCGADRWTLLETRDEFRWPGDPTWYGGNTYSSYLNGIWHYNEARDGSPMYCYCGSHLYTVELARVRFKNVYDEAGRLWYAPLSGYVYLNF